MERRRKYNRHFLQTMHITLPPVLLVTQLSLLISFCSFFVIVDYAECIMTFREETGVYSLFPDEDLKTGRKRLRFDDETTIRSYRDGRDYSFVRSYPMLPHDRLHRPVDFSGGREGVSRPIYDDFRDRERDRERHGRVYFDDRFRSSRFDFHRLTPRPRPIERPVNPIIFETSRRPPPFHHHFLPDNFPPGPPAIGQSKLPPGASSRASGEDVPTRIHVFNPESNSFGNPRNAGGSREDDGPPSSSERAKGPPSNFVETGPPGPESFLNHEEFLEYQKKIAFARFHEQDGRGNGGGSSAGDGEGKKVLFESKEPFEIDGLVPPDKSGENSGKLPATSKVPPQNTRGQSPSSTSSSFTPSQQHEVHRQSHQQDQRHLQRTQQQQQQREGQKVRTNDANNRPQQHHRHNPNEEAEEERDTGGGEVESDIVNEKGDEVESENGKSEVTQLPPTHITKSGRAYHRHQQHHSGGDRSTSNSGSASDHSGGGGASSGSSGRSSNKKFIPSISHDEGRGGTEFKLPTTAVSYSDEPPNLNGFVPVVPFHLIGAEQPRAISLERPRQQQQHRIVPHHLHEAPVHSTTATTTTTSTSAPTRSIPFPTTIPTTTARSKGEKSGFRSTTEAAKLFTPSHQFISTGGTRGDENTGNTNNGGNVNSGFGSSPAGPILHATAGERSNSETHSKVAITKQQELKRLQKQRQLSSSIAHQLITPPPHSAGLFPDIGLGDSSASSDSADNSDNPGILFTNNSNNGFLDEMVTPYTSKDMLPSPTSTPTQQDIIHYNTPPSTTMPPSYSSQHNSVKTIDSSSKHKTQDLPTKPSELHLHPTHIDTYHINANNDKNYTHDDTMKLDEQKGKTEVVVDLNNSVQEHGSVILGDDETIKAVAHSESVHNGLFDTRAVKIANGIKQGEFLLEGYMINSNNEEDASGDGVPPYYPLDSGSSSYIRSRSNADPDYLNNNINNVNEENDDKTHNQLNYHRHLYDYPDQNYDNLPMLEELIVGTSSSPTTPPDNNDDDRDGNHNHQDNIPLSPVIPQLPGTTTPDLEQNLTPSPYTTVRSPTPYLVSNNPENPTLTDSKADDDGSATTSQQRNGGEDVTGNEDFSKSNEPSEEDEHSRSSPPPAPVVNDVVVDDVAFESEPTPPPELRRTRLSEINENNFSVADAPTPTNPFYSNNDSANDNNAAFFPYYDTYGNKINATSSSSITNSRSSSSSSSSNNRNGDDDEIFNFSGSGEGANPLQDENGAFENDEEYNFLQTDRKLSSSSSSSSSSSHADVSIQKKKHTSESNSKIVRLKIMDASGNFVDGDDNPSSISIPVEATLNYNTNNGVDSGSPNGYTSNSISSSDGSSVGAVSNSASGDNSVDNINDDVSDSFGISKNFGAAEDYGVEQISSLLNSNSAPLYLESSETLLNKTYYLDGNYNDIHASSKTNDDKDSNSKKSSNFIKVTRIKTTSGPSSQETAGKTSAAILARRTSKPAVIVSTSAAGVRPKVVGSVVEAGPAWPGLVSNFLRANGQYNTNRSFTATATVRPRGNSGTNPSPPSTIISGQVQQITHEQLQQQIQQKQQPPPLTQSTQQHHHHHRQQSPHTPPPPPQLLQQQPPPTKPATEFQLHQIRIPTVTSIGSASGPLPNNPESKNRNFANHHNPDPTTNSNPNQQQNTNNKNSSSIIIRNSAAIVSANNNLAKQVNSKVIANSSNQHAHNNSSSNNATTSDDSVSHSKGHTIARRLYSSSEEIKSNSSSGIVSLVHAHISHCPKLHSPTEVICDVHIREGHGVANPQLTVGWRRKFYNSTQPDVLLALNKAPASGENGHFEPHHSIMEVEPGKQERLEEFHDKFNVTLAPGISPMLRSVLLIRSVTAPDCGTYQCEVNDGINVLKSETLLFLCH